MIHKYFKLNQGLIQYFKFTDFYNTISNGLQGTVLKITICHQGRI